MDHGPTIRIEDLLEHTGWLRRLARHLVADPADAEDVVQMTFLAALERPGQRRGGPRAWLAGVARNVARQLGRSEARRTHRERRAARPEALPCADHISQIVETQQLLSRAVLELDEPFRTAVFLRYYEGSTPARIAERLGVPASTVRVRLKRARHRLRERLERDHGGNPAAWTAALVPLTVPTPGEQLAAAGSSSAAASGVLLMSLHLKLLVGAFLLVGLSVAIWWATAHAPESAPQETAVPTLRSAVEPVAEGTGPLAGSAAIPAEADRRAAVAAPESTVADPAPVAEACCVVGRVLDPDGTALPGARLEAVDGLPRDPRLLVVLEQDLGELTAVSDEGGRFRIEVPADRAFLIRASHPGFAPGHARNAFAGERRDVVLERGFRLRVTVTAEEDGRSLAGVGVNAESVEGYGSPNAWSLGARTDSHGVAELERVPAGPFLVHARKDGFAGRSVRRAGAAGESPLELSLVLRTEAVVTGRVLDAVHELPLAEAEVRAGSEPSTRTDGNGRFRLGGITAASNVSRPVIASAPGYAPEVVYVELSEAGTARDVVLRLRPAARVVGRVVDSHESPVAGASVVYRGRFSTNPYTAEVHQGETRADDYGRFELEVQPTGEYTLAAQAPGFAAARTTFGPMGEGSGGRPRDLGDVALSLAGTICGEVRGRDQDPANPDLVRLGAGDVRVASAVVTRDGRFRLTELPAGSFELTLHSWDPKDRRHSDAAVSRRSVTLAEGQRLAGVALLPATLLRGVVRGPDGSPHRGSRVVILDEQSGVELASTWTSNRGGFELLADGPGPYRVVATDPALSFDPVTADGVLPGTTDLDLRLRPRDTGLSITGRLVDERGVPVADVYVHFTRAATGLALSRVALPDEQGRWSMENLDDEVYYLSVVDFADRYEPAAHRGVRPGSEPVELVLVVR